LQEDRRRDLSRKGEGTPAINAEGKGRYHGGEKKAAGVVPEPAERKQKRECFASKKGKMGGSLFRLLQHRVRGKSILTLA